ncbi:MAG: hypothetical protein A3J76_05045 [Candidatus Moranbacteria bacterium RBG_13_45_13]|nr:MAG: hypothetical protein A3J76_05045 [Candidatus Moranbacteria bacterium RBG_13_45_13]
MQFYHSLITEKSYELLQNLKRGYRFILIGGWAVYLYTRALKSKDIDIIVDYDELAKLKKNFDVFKNDRLKKYEIKTGEFDIDVYLPHYSKLGIPIGEIEKKTVVRKGFSVPEPEILFLLKLYAWRERRGSAKGWKDELDIFSLAFLPEFDWDRYQDYIRAYKFKEINLLFLDLVKKTSSIQELKINDQKMSKIRKVILGKLEK